MQHLIFHTQIIPAHANYACLTYWNRWPHIDKWTILSNLDRNAMIKFPLLAQIGQTRFLKGHHPSSACVTWSKTVLPLLTSELDIFTFTVEWGESIHARNTLWKAPSRHKMAWLETKHTRRWHACGGPDLLEGGICRPCVVRVGSKSILSTCRVLKGW